MGTLRKTVQREILDQLNSTVFSSDDFYVSFGNSDASQDIFSIKFVHDENYNYKVKKWEMGNLTRYYVTMRPGEVEDMQTITFDTLQQAISALPGWCLEIRNDLKAGQPLYKEIDELRKMIHESISGSSGEANEFSVAEIAELKERFRILEERVTKLEADKIITENQLHEFMEGLGQITDDIEFYPKETWIKTATNKLVKIIVGIGKSREGRKVLADGARKLLGLD